MEAHFGPSANSSPDFTPKVTNQSTT